MRPPQAAAAISPAGPAYVGLVLPCRCSLASRQHQHQGSELLVARAAPLDPQESGLV